ncbi:MAG: hypothetical protein AAFV93_06655 [Chloroflexota bacterium]
MSFWYTSNLSHQNYRHMISWLVVKIEDNSNDPNILQRLRNEYEKLQNDLKQEDLTESERLALHSTSYRCSIAILTWGELDVIASVYRHRESLTHECHVAGMNRMASSAFNQIVNRLLLACSNRDDMPIIEWYLANQDQLEWSETLQRVILKKWANVKIQTEDKAKS